MNYIVVLDTETNWHDEVMSIGIVKVNADSFALKESKYYVIDPAYKSGGMYDSVLFSVQKKHCVVLERKKAISEIKKWLAENKIDSIYAYNGCFDKNHLPELCKYKWFDIMKIAAYKQYNRKIPKNAECCKTGRLKSNYGVEEITRLLSGDRSYCEYHNALQDAKDEAAIMKMIALPLDVYESARI